MGEIHVFYYVEPDENDQLPKHVPIENISYWSSHGGAVSAARLFAGRSFEITLTTDGKYIGRDDSVNPPLFIIVDKFTIDLGLPAEND